MEDGILAQLRQLVDYTSEQLQWNHLTSLEAIELIQQTQTEAEKLIPDRMELYHLIYTSRFHRLLEQFVLPGQFESKINRHEPY